MTYNAVIIGIVMEGHEGPTLPNRGGMDRGICIKPLKFREVAMVEENVENLKVHETRVLVCSSQFSHPKMSMCDSLFQNPGYATDRNLSVN